MRIRDTATDSSCRDTFWIHLGVLVLAMPLFLITACAAAADGLITWYLRRTGAGRESGFIYHRTKRGLALSVLALWLVYLVPPIPLDPRWVIPPVLGRKWKNRRSVSSSKAPLCIRAFLDFYLPHQS